MFLGSEKEEYVAYITDKEKDTNAKYDNLEYDICNSPYSQICTIPYLIGSMAQFYYGNYIESYVFFMSWVLKTPAISDTATLYISYAVFPENHSWMKWLFILRFIQFYNTTLIQFLRDRRRVVRPQISRYDDSMIIGVKDAYEANQTYFGFTIQTYMYIRWYGVFIHFIIQVLYNAGWIWLRAPLRGA